ncbi:AraC family transcriptional regulator [Staphylococcus sp. Marseille-Q1834]|uniref:AraC family transcriptional regulator n=1 Tax=Staphylococcus sp. Marseille-Q1834 TaxID=2866594 RepID=UPI0012B93D76|nr:AraC family transcriptional regulator [Staphylococcus sp. Marseille-Q1834]
MDKEKLEIIKTHALEFFNLQIRNFHIYDVKSIGKCLQTPFTNTRSQSFKSELSHLIKNMKSKYIYKYTNSFKVNYLLFKFNKHNQLIVIGPFLITRPSESECHELLQERNMGVDRLDDFKQYMLSIPLCQQVQVEKTARLAVKFLKGKANYDTIQPIEFNFHIKQESFSESINEFNFTLNQLEERYNLENQFLNEVANGNSEKALSLFQQTFAIISGIERGKDALVTKKYLAYLMNTLCRKVIERSGVNLLTVDALSTKYAFLIDSEKSVEGIFQLTRDLITEYANASMYAQTLKYSSKINKAIQYLELHLSYEVHLDDLAAAVNLTPAYLSRLFKKEVGETISQYLKQLRVKKSEDLVANTDMNFEYIAHYVGFKDQSYYTTCFKQYYGVSPKKYRRLKKEGML